MTDFTEVMKHNYSKEDLEKIAEEIRIATRQDRERDAEMYPTFGKTNNY